MLSCFLKYNYLHEIIENIHVHSWIRFLERTTNRMQTMSSYLENRLTIYVLCTLYRWSRKKTALIVSHIMNLETFDEKSGYLYENSL